MPKRSFNAPWVQQLLLGKIGDRSNQVGVVAADLATGESAMVNPDFQCPAASVAKVPIAMTLLHYVTTGGVSLSDTVAYHSATDYEEGSGSLRYSIKEGDAFAVDYLLDRMITVSDNIARNMLERYVGSETVRAYMLDLSIDPPYYAPWPMMTARGAAICFARLNAGTAGVNAEMTSLLLNLLERTVYNDRIPALLPRDVTVAHKVGTLTYNVHDAGIVYAPDRSFILAAMTDHLAYDEAVDLIAHLAAIVYWYEDWLVTAGN